MKAENLKEIMEQKKWFIEDSSITKFKCPFEITPKKFLEFAESDLQDESEKSLINALSNIKRAIDCQIESLLYIFCHWRISHEEKWGFQAKIKFIKNLEILTPRILQKIIKNRNLLEHEFKKPTRDQTEDFLDIAVLFIHYSEKFFSLNTDLGIAPTDLDEEESERINLNLDPSKGFIEANYIPKQKENPPIKYSKLEITPKDKEFIYFLKMYISLVDNIYPAN